MPSNREVPNEIFGVGQIDEAEREVRQDVVNQVMNYQMDQAAEQVREAVVEAAVTGTSAMEVPWDLNPTDAWMIASDRDRAAREARQGVGRPEPTTPTLGIQRMREAVRTLRETQLTDDIVMPVFQPIEPTMYDVDTGRRADVDPLSMRGEMERIHQQRIDNLRLMQGRPMAMPTTESREGVTISSSDPLSNWITSEVPEAPRVERPIPEGEIARAARLYYDPLVMNPLNAYSNFITMSTGRVEGRRDFEAVKAKPEDPLADKPVEEKGMKKIGLLALLDQLKVQAENKEITVMTMMELVKLLVEYINDPQIKERVDVIPF